MKYNLIVLIFTVTVLTSCGGNKTEEASTDKQSGNTEQKEDNNETSVTSAEFGDLLVELESNMGWSSVNADWKMRRDSWVESCLASGDNGEKASLLTEFETYVEWSAVNPDWSDRRDLWIEDVLAAQTDGDLGMLLAEFESYVLWEVVSPNWVNVRERWIKDCENLNQGSW
ncbi:MAG: hypothetical protein IPM77_11315 [Crocinitomicaceae bacterium]|nr:hypothetical protein [Crocinitomicaceae bacterium]